MKIKLSELIKMLQDVEKKVDSDEVEIHLHTGTWTANYTSSLHIEDIGFSYGGDGENAYIDVILLNIDFDKVKLGIENYEKYGITDEEEEV